ncbi:HAD-IIIA family hydrolase [Polynucleobacter sp. 86C-FISCH]|uniref:HAD-IIIA family hydrolase n=1 Tax=Polynucleobacter sp. 86C-FISCH TaxID=2689101 RepID=UPI001C0D6C33|nr:HAD-IIIA family hydrolase [Polynucleobacter sp. 86C-FISCH]MBU3596009.1 HAD-IIIA family hydrolase [Polynucleobacter sp. 86C-FISCH]
MKKQAIILAGGKGTRLSERLGGLPKPLIDICGKPLLERQIELLLHHHFTDILILVNHRAQDIIDFCNSRNNWGISLKCVNDGEPLGTAGAVLAIQNLLEDDFLVMYGDTMLDVDLTRFGNFHRANNHTSGTLFLHPNDHPHDSDLVEIDGNGFITDFHPYPHDQSVYYQNLVNAALYYLRREALSSFSSSVIKADFGRDFFPYMLDNGHTFLGYNSFEYIKDAGTPKRLDKVCQDFLSGRVKRARLDEGQAAVFLDRDGTINREVNHLSTSEQFELLPGVGQAINALNNADYRAVVITNQPVLARGDCSYDELKVIHNKMETLLGKEGAFLDRIYYCPHHPECGFEGEVKELKIKCVCRKPGRGMVDQAVIDLNIDIKKSWLVGDTTGDILLANNCGLRSVLVETGYAGLDERYMAIPSYTVPDLSAAADLILKIHPYYLDICTKFGSEIKSGDFVFIGGLSRSGKTNFSSTLKDYLWSNGINAVVISVDRWLRNHEERELGVLGRYELEELKLFINELSGQNKRAEVTLSSYQKLTRKRIQNSNSMVIDPSDVVIIEGTIALNFVSDISLRRTHGFFLEIDEVERRDRVINEYRLRGLDNNEAEALYLLREVDEAPIIRMTSKNATNVIHINTLGNIN